MSGVGDFFIVLVVLILLGGGGWVAYTQIRARRAGLPPPTLKSYIPFLHGRDDATANYPAPRSGGIGGWIKDKLDGLRNKRTAGGAYEEAGLAGGVGGAGGGGAGSSSRRGHRMDPDEAWDARVGGEADAYGPGGYYEEQELGLRPHEPYGGAGYGASTPGLVPAMPEYGHGDERGRSRSREPETYVGGGQRGLDQRYAEEMAGAGAQSDPFGDHAEVSSQLRDVSPRPDSYGGKGHQNNRSLEDSPQERRSMFRENV